MEITIEQVYELVVQNQNAIEELRLELAEFKNSIKYWIAIGAVLAIPYAIFIHRYLHPTERFFERKIEEVDKLIKEAGKIIF